MMAFIRRVFGRSATPACFVSPITHHDVEPAPRDPVKEQEVKEAQIELAHALVRHGRRSWEVRQELAGNALNIVSGKP